MIEEDIEVFIDGVNRFFNEVNDMEVEVGTPYIIDNKRPASYDYTGMIGISGARKGCVYVSAPRALLRSVLIGYGVKVIKEETIIDVVGEIANTVSGNARTEFGKDFMISVPVVVQGAPEAIYFPEDSNSYVIPIEWKTYKACIVVCLKDK